MRLPSYSHITPAICNNRTYIDLVPSNIPIFPVVHGHSAVALFQAAGDIF